MPRSAQIGDQARGIGEGEAGVELQPHGRAGPVPSPGLRERVRVRVLRGARGTLTLALSRVAGEGAIGATHFLGRSVATAAIRAAVASACNSVSAGSGIRRRQFGCSSIVPGRFGCSSWPSKSSIGSRHSGDGVRATKRQRGVHHALRRLPAAAARLPRGPRRAKRCHSAARSPSRSAAARSAVTPSPSRPHSARRRCRCRATSRRRSAGRVWWSSPRPSRPMLRADVKPLCSPRSNHSTRMPCMPSLLSVSRKPAGTVPRSSPTTIALCRADSSASSRSRSVERIGRIGAVGRIRAFRHQPQPRQPHGVVDAQAAGVAQHRAQRGDERRRSRRPPGRAARSRSGPSPGRAD